MPAIARITDIGSAHDSYPDTDVIGGSSTADVNNLPVCRVTDPIRPHSSPSPSPEHPRYLAKGSSNTDFDSLDVGYISCPVDCGGLIVTGSSDTNIN